MELKAQDTLLALKYWSLNQKGQLCAVRELSDLLGISASEVSKGTRRLQVSHLLVERDGQIYAETNALLEWICYGVRYAYPLESAGYGRGMATAWNCKLVHSEMVAPSPPWVWALPGGDTEGILIQAFHHSVPYAASKDELLYQAFALIEVIRGGKPRELAIARDLLKELIKRK